MNKLKDTNPKLYKAMENNYNANKVSDEEISEIYSAIDALMKNENWNFLNDYYDNLALRAWRLPLDILIAYADVSFESKNKIDSRKRFMDTCIHLHPNKELWKGLE